MEAFSREGLLSLLESVESAISASCSRAMRRLEWSEDAEFRAHNGGRNSRSLRAINR